MKKLADGLLFDCLDHPHLIAVVEDSRVTDLWADQDSSERLGAVHLARITGRFDHHQRLSGQLLSGTSVSWPIKGKARFTQGQLVPVTLTATARQDKPVQAVAGIELAGRFTLLRWRGGEAGRVYLSRKAGKQKSDELQMSKLNELCQHTGALAAGFDVVVRRSALLPDNQLDKAIFTQIQAEVTKLLAGWAGQADNPEELQTQTQPRLIYTGPPLDVLLGQLYPELPVRQLGPGDVPVVQDAYDKAVKTRYETSHGAVFWIEQTRAAVTIDIDSAASKLAPDRLCELVLPELFTQICLRRLSGKIVIDMPYIANHYRRSVLTEIDQLARRDPRYPDCLGFTRSGLVELSVRHDRPILNDDDTIQSVIEQLAKKVQR